MTEIVWVLPQVVLAIHDEQIAEHGGAPGIRDKGVFLSAMSRPKNLNSLESCTDLAALAAAYGFGVAQNHPFVDGNKRTAFVTMRLFLALNNAALKASDAECVLMMFDLASGSLSEDELCKWLKKHM